ncbi:MAG TPA: DivIVA domain-containing protein [Actinomycetota bacterium]
MSATELDLPILMSSEQIRRREFVTIRRGYDPDQVRDYLEQLADQVDRMAAMIREARLEAATATSASTRPRVDPYDRLAQRVASVIREADQAAERLRTEAQEETDGMLRDARTDADRIRTDAQARAEEARSQAERALREAQEQADRTIAGLAAQRENLIQHLDQMRERLLGVAGELEDVTSGPPPVAWPASTPAGTEEVVDIAAQEDPASRSAPVEPAGQRERLFEPPPDPSFQEVWEGTETVRLDLPDIPPLDLSWDDEDEDRDESPAEEGREGPSG